MKKIIAFLLLINTAYGQTTTAPKAPGVPFPKDANGKIVYAEEVKVDGVTKADLIVRAGDWLMKTYKLPTDSVITNDKTTGKIVVKSRLNVTQVYFQKAQDAGNVRYTINVMVSEGKFSYSVDGFIHEKGGEVPSLGYIGRPYSEIKDLGIYKEDYRDIQKQVDAKTLTLIKSLKEAMALAPKEKK
jgi:hypothetical protein